jgi:hypothetical protein
MMERTHMDRRTFLMSSGALTLGAFAPRIPCIAAELAASESFVWNPGGLLFSFEIASGRLRRTFPQVSKSRFNAAERIHPIKA